MRFSHSIDGTTYRFDTLGDLLAKASPERSGDHLAEIAAGDDAERMTAQMALADVPLTVFLDEWVVPYEDDEVTRLIADGHDSQAFATVSHLTVGGPRLGEGEAHQRSVSSTCPSGRDVRACSS